MQSAANFLGGCICGRTRYRVTSAPQAVTNCHCQDCRRSSGAPYVTWAAVPATDFEIVTGSIKTVEHSGRIRGFSACCGGLLMMKDSNEDPYVEITVATLDDPSAFRPEKNIWIEDKMPWVSMDASLPAYPRNAVS